jgi:hypothetical protein
MTLAVAITAAAGVSLIAFGATAMLAPAQAGRFLLGFAATAQRHWLELGFRFLVGLGFVQAASQLPATTLFSGLGWILLITTAVMAVVPWGTHRDFARRYVPRALQFTELLGVASLCAGVAIVWSAYASSPA